MQYKSYLVEKNINTLKEDCFLFYGENIGLINDLKNKIKKNNSNCELINFLQEDILKNNSHLLNEISNLSLFEKKKIIFIDQVSDKILELIKIIVQEKQNQKIYLFSNVLDKKSKLRNFFEKSSTCGIVPCYNDNEVGIKKIIQEKLDGFKGLSPKIINVISENCNLNRLKLNNEINKIKAFFQEKNINQEELEILLNTKENDEFNLLKDEALLGNKIKTNKLLSDTLIEQDKNIYYLTLINQRLHRLLEVCKDKDQVSVEKKIEKLKPPIFWKDKANFLNQIKKWKKVKILHILKKTYELELNVKSSPITNKNILIKKLIVEICDLANA